MLRLNNLKSTSKKRKRVGRGGDLGGTSGRGHKGQRSRSGIGGEIKPSFEGGQMSLARRLPKRGFNNRFKKDVRIVNLKTLGEKFADGETVNEVSLRERNLIKGQGKFFIKVLGNGELGRKLNVCVHAFSKSAKEAIEKSGGKTELIKEIKGDSTTA